METRISKFEIPLPNMEGKMRHEYFAVRIRKAIEKDSHPGSKPTFSGGEFAPDLVNKLKAHLRAVEEAQVRSVQPFKEVIKSQTIPGSSRSHGKIWDQIVKARKEDL